ncbi:hypothetical protein HEB94_001019 [Actinopolymorpha pittospori]|uniref:Uncharacterized protein n=1 Tax=Actinopolymorpha pittospori TaxID=648752 RepID=A0A927RGF3_9ACTN|nr:hypothetical protein [Actinopolymorpha pittospori]
MMGARAWKALEFLLAAIVGLVYVAAVSGR